MIVEIANAAWAVATSAALYVHSRHRPMSASPPQPSAFGFQERVNFAWSCAVPSAPSSPLSITSCARRPWVVCEVNALGFANTAWCEAMLAARGARSSRHGSLPARRVSRTWSSQNVVSSAWVVPALQPQCAPARGEAGCAASADMLRDTSVGREELASFAWVCAMFLTPMPPPVAAPCAGCVRLPRGAT
eukprot:NODE_10486_length_1348_cov_2.360360.p1 GENE.NODE_10486_length_1348_cov_2.360360~~NODE_10486_length_1348_cov_2.360360.p1  ORF type:complete len:190 (-),score=38.05 NODE_10486_length_1348_cov_2.360360:513-1082(-)